MFVQYNRFTTLLFKTTKMNRLKPIVTIILLLTALSLCAQRVQYKDNYYTLVNSKIFHLGHNVYGKLTQGERDTLYLIAKELYNDIGKLKPHYKSRRKRDRYKLPEGYWDQKNKTATPGASVEATNAAIMKATRQKDHQEKEKKNEKKKDG